MNTDFRDLYSEPLLEKMQLELTMEGGSKQETSESVSGQYDQNTQRFMMIDQENK